MSFPHLHVPSHYSLLDGLGKVDQLLSRAQELGMKSLALTDHGAMYGAIEFYETARKMDIKPLIGVEAYIAPRRLTDKTAQIDTRPYHLVLLAKNYEGYKNLLILTTEAHTKGYYYKPRIDKHLLKKLAKKLKAPLVATNDIHYVKTADREPHDVLICVQTGKTVNDSDRMTYDGDFSMRSPQDMAETFKDTPEAISNTSRIAEMCDLEIPLGKEILPVFPLPKGKKDNQYLEELCQAGLKKRFAGKMTPEIKERLSYELLTIEKMGFAPYFLIVQDFVNYAKSDGILVGPGRGSAAGSIVTYLLNITDLDP